jgi:myosin heavy subunit
MSFFNNLKRALGFNSDGDAIDELDYYEMSGRAPYVNPFKKDPIAPAADDTVKETAPMAEPATPARTEGNAETGLQAASERDKDAAAEQALAKAKEALRLAEAGRRAAQARANELAERMSALESENEQIELEKKSLLNKLKVMQVRAGEFDNPEAAQRVDDLANLSEQLQQAQKDAADKQQAIAHLETQLADATAKLQAMQQLQQQLDDAKLLGETKNSQITALKQQLAEFEQMGAAADEELKAKLKLAQEQEIKLQKQINDMNRQAKVNAERQNRRDIDLANRIDELKQQAAAMAHQAEQKKQEDDKRHEEDVTRIEKLQQQLQQAWGEAKNALTERDKALQDLDEARRLQVQAEAGEQAAAEKAAHARDEARALRDQIKELQRQIRQLKRELHAAGEAPIVDPAAIMTAQPATVDDILEIIDDLPTQQERVIEPEPEPEPELKKEPEPEPTPLKQDDFSAGLDDIDWLMPAEPTIEPPQSEVEASPEPAPLPQQPIQPEPAADGNPRQLSLF